MTVKELKEILEKVNENLEVVVETPSGVRAISDITQKSTLYEIRYRKQTQIPADRLTIGV